MTTEPHQSSRRTLVTGGAGFVGSHLVERLVARGDAVTVVDDLSTGRHENIIPGSAALIESRLSHALADELAGAEPFDEVYHLAATVGVALVMRDQAASIENNVAETAALLAYLENHGAPRTLIASSSEVYGKPSTDAFSEDDDVVYGPTSVGRWSYACSKAIDEYLALAHHRDRGLPVVVARLFNTVGPRQVGSYGMVLPRFVASALAGEPLEVHGDGEQSRCFADVRDVCAALVALTGEPACVGRIFNVGADESITINGLAELVIDELGSSSELVHVPYGEVYPEGFEDIRRRRPDLTRVRSAIGWEPSTDLRKTVRDLADSLGPARSAGSPAP